MRRTFNELYAFTVVARHRSFTRAAAHLGMSQSALSQTVKNLEENLGVRLLTRSTRSVSPTEAGERLLSRLGPQFDEMEDALEALNSDRQTPRGTIRISAGEHPAIAVLQPKLADFLETYPDITVEIGVDGGMIDIVAESFDAGVRLGQQVAKDMIAVRISADIRMCMIATPGYLERHGTPKAPEDLTDHRCINTRLPTHNGVFAWELEKDGEETRVRVEGPATFNNLPLRLASALDGIGIGYLPFDRVEPYLKAGQLVPVLEDWWPIWEGYHLYYPNRRQMSPAFRLLIDHLRHRV
ncbi:LysR family transcriptional regulator [Allosediminivita pacifica]|uniref:DNA-binding transcriptional LysR family regulator n=1 Tax=Allosediminivita pacifica TaxID=1267769 RepID=A0A2T6A932_9RHOB|nr:LysR family transcriptional regulator [Allosediminivita pacifica]PTX40300.1 DNA-binding transcriptional LysR family regulator [Allosediminivita pacifica]GGB26652.1 LysR family transcriptional regulator [Allosediminivita pacifica]